MKIFRIAAAAALASSAIIGIGATPASAAPVASEVIFNDPRNNTAIQDKIVSLINSAPTFLSDGQTRNTIRVSIYLFTTAKPIADALIAAHQRGVSVQIITDSAYGTAAQFTRVKDAVATQVAQGQNSKSKICTTGCHGTARNHNKFILFDRTGDSDRVLLQTSQNFSAAGGGTDAWNNAVVISGSTGIYPSYVTYFNDLWKDTTNTNYYRTTNGTWSDVAFYPKSSGDPVADKINSVVCKYTDAQGASRVSDIRIAASKITSTRGTLITALKNKKNQGCWIDIVTTYDSSAAAQKEAKDTLTAAGIQYRTIDKSNAHILHSKYLLIDGKIGSTITKLTWTGSANFDWESLRSADETILNLKQIGSLNTPAAIHDAFRCNFWKVRHYAGGAAVNGCTACPSPPPPVARQAPRDPGHAEDPEAGGPEGGGEASRETVFSVSSSGGPEGGERHRAPAPQARGLWDASRCGKWPHTRFPLFPITEGANVFPCAVSDASVARPSEPGERTVTTTSSLEARPSRYYPVIINVYPPDCLDSDGLPGLKPVALG